MAFDKADDLTFTVEAKDGFSIDSVVYSINGGNAPTLEAKDGKYTIPADTLSTVENGKLNIRVIVVPDPTVTISRVMAAYDENGDAINGPISVAPGDTLTFVTPANGIRVRNGSGTADIRSNGLVDGRYSYTLSNITGNVIIEPTN